MGLIYAWSFEKVWTSRERKANANKQKCFHMVKNKILRIEKKNQIMLSEAKYLYIHGFNLCFVI